MLLPNRHESSNEYRYGFQGQEKDDEIKGEGNSLNYKYRMHDPRIGRFFAVDPLAPKYPHNSPYAFSENSTIAFVELEGLERYYAADGKLLGQVGDNYTMRIVSSEYTNAQAKEIIANYNSGVENSTNSYFGLVFHGVTDFDNSSSTIKQNVIRSIYSDELGFNLGDLTGRKFDLNIAGFANCNCNPNKRVIGLDPSIQGDWSSLTTALVKENVHVLDYKLFPLDYEGANATLNQRDLRAYTPVLKSPYFDLMSNDNKRAMFESAASFLWPFLNEMIIHKGIDDALYNQYKNYTDGLLNEWSKYGIEIDFTPIYDEHNFEFPNNPRQHTTSQVSEANVTYKGEKL